MGRGPTFASETWGHSGRTPEQQRQLEETRAARAKTKRRRDERRKSQEKMEQFGVIDVPDIKVRCDVCGYEQEDVMVFADKDCGTRFGPLKVRICPSCQTIELQRRNLSVIGPAVAEEAVDARGMPITQGVEKRVRMF